MSVVSLSAASTSVPSTTPAATRDGRAFGAIVLAAFLLYGVGSATAHRPAGMALVIANSLAVSYAGLIGFRLLRRGDGAAAMLYFAARVAEAALRAGGIMLAQHADFGDADLTGYLLAMSVLGTGFQHTGILEQRL